ncbi:hypothetical protein [Streptomyces lydicus]|uniref:hypothetical protein n=1 Tax=Streptomyces lydicus TaxID=47763 RepID=UPI00101067C2|nr:hypothetical protein [Streptomyces lydicus]MCZ1009727.1 hypothetical protein [Streptomyces lydicus]
MTDRERSRRFRVRTALAAFAAVTVLAAGGVWFGQASDRASAVDAAPKTAAVQDVKEDAKPRSGLPGVRDCGFGTPVSKPHVITLACRDAGTVATGITWKYYGAREAFGAGVVQVEKTTGGGADSGFPATFRLFAPKAVDGGLVFTGLEVRYEGSTPLGDTTEMYNLA